MVCLRWLNAAFLVLAACRALVPGLCATLAASQETHARIACADCCSKEKAPSDGPAVRTPPVERGPCGLCNLMHGMLDPVHPVALNAPAPGAFAEIPFRADVAVQEIPRTRHGRAPPVIG